MFGRSACKHRSDSINQKIVITEKKKHYIKMSPPLINV